MSEEQPAQAAPRTTLTELAALFLRLGTVAFGGPAAHIAMMRQEVVTRRAWLTDERFLDLLGACNLIPGPNSTELAIHIGFERRRWAGLSIAGFCFIAPAALITGMLGYAYVRYGKLLAAEGLFYGLKPVILAVVLDAVWGLAPKAAATIPLRIIAVASALVVALGHSELLVLFAAGLTALLVRFARARRDAGRPYQQAVPLLGLLVQSAAHVESGVPLTSLFGVFVKIGSVLFGSGYVLLSFLRADLVERLGWLSEEQLIDAIAVGQITPGPVFTTATFIGYLLRGSSGALVATAGIFLPAFVFVALSGPLIPKLRASPSSAAFLDGVNAASLALMAVVTLQLGRTALIDPLTLLIGLISVYLLLRYRVSATWLLVGGGLLGLLKVLVC
jgi:chromate transporter